MESTDIIGTWHLQSFLFRSEDGDEFHPYGSEIEGQLIYAKDGHMNVMLSFAPTPDFSVDEQVAGTISEKIAAYDRFSAYCGRYERRDGAIVHHVEMSLFPNWIGTEQYRRLEFRGDSLVLSMPPKIIDGAMRTVEAVWSRHKKARD